MGLAPFVRGLALHEPRRVAPSLVTLWRHAGANIDPDPLLDSAPPPEAPVADAVAWCADRLREITAAEPDAVANARQLGLVVGVLRDTYAHGGWAVAASTIAIVDAGLPAPDWGTLVREVSIESTARYVEEIVRDALACRDLRVQCDALAEIGWPAPGSGVVELALAAAVTAIRRAEPVAAIRAVALLDHGLGRAIAWTGGAETPVVSAAGRELRPALIDWLEAQAAEPWTWAALRDWSERDPLAWAKAISRVTRAPAWVASLDDVRRSVPRALVEPVDAAWRIAVQALASSAPSTADPCAGAVATLAEIATERAAARIGEVVARARRGEAIDDRLLASLVGDPRECPELWRDAADPVIAAVAERG